MKLLKYLLLASLLLSACTQNNVEENKQQATTPPVEQTEPAVTTTTPVVTTTPKVTTTVTTTTPVVKEPITEYMGIPVNWFNDDAYLETNLFKPFIIDGRFQSVGEDKTLYVWYSHCTEGNSYSLPFMPGGRVGCTLLNEKATNDMIDAKPFLAPATYGEFTYEYKYSHDKSRIIDSSTFDGFVAALEGYVQFPDYFMYFQESEMFTINFEVITVKNNNGESIKFIIETILENGFIVSIISSNEDLDTFIRLYVPKDNAAEFVEDLFESLEQNKPLTNQDSTTQDDEVVVDYELREHVESEVSKLGIIIIIPTESNGSYYYEFPNIGFTMVMDYQFHDEIIVLERMIKPEDTEYYSVELLAFNKENENVEIYSYADLIINTKDQIDECNAEESGCNISVISKLNDNEYIV